MCLEFDFTYAVQILLRSVNSLSYYIYIYMKTKIVIILKNKSKIKKFSGTKCDWNSILHMLYKFYQDRWANTWRGDVISYRKFHRNFFLWKKFPPFSAPFSAWSLPLATSLHRFFHFSIFVPVLPSCGSLILGPSHVWPYRHGDTGTACTSTALWDLSAIGNKAICHHRLTKVPSVYMLIEAWNSSIYRGHGVSLWGGFLHIPPIQDPPVPVVRQPSKWSLCANTQHYILYYTEI